MSSNPPAAAAAKVVDRHVRWETRSSDGATENKSVKVNAPACFATPMPRPSSEGKKTVTGGIRVGNTLFKREDVRRIKIMGDLILVSTYNRDGTVGPNEAVHCSSHADAEMAMRIAQVQM
jgi:hypothetical protein